VLGVVHPRQLADKLAAIEWIRDAIISLGDTLATASPEATQVLIALLVQEVRTDDRAVSDVVWVPAARPFFTSPAPSWRPGTVLGDRRSHDALT